MFAHAWELMEKLVTLEWHVETLAILFHKEIDVVQE